MKRYHILKILWRLPLAVFFLSILSFVVYSIFKGIPRFEIGYIGNQDLPQALIGKPRILFDSVFAGTYTALLIFTIQIIDSSKNKLSRFDVVFFLFTGIMLSIIVMTVPNPIYYMLFVFIIMLSSILNRSSWKTAYIGTILFALGSIPIYGIIYGFVNSFCLGIFVLMFSVMILIALWVIKAITSEKTWKIIAGWLLPRIKE